jgi:hypothetical protein
MGIPYSKQINNAFDQVTPLVAAGFKVLETTKNIAILMAYIQVFTAAVLAMILLALLGLIFTVNPDLETEREQLVTPVMQWLASWIFTYGAMTLLFVKIFVVLFVAALGLFLAKGSIVGTTVPGEGEREGPDDNDDETPEN